MLTLLPSAGCVNKQLFANKFAISTLKVIIWQYSVYRLFLPQVATNQLLQGCELLADKTSVFLLKYIFEWRTIFILWYCYVYSSKETRINGSHKVSDTKEIQMMSAEDFGGVRDRSTEVLLTQRCVSLQKHNSAFYSTTLSFPLSLQGNQLQVGNVVRKGKITQKILYSTLSLSNCILIVWVNKEIIRGNELL